MEPDSQALAEIEEAIALYGRGGLAQARNICRGVLQRHPSHFDALHLLGVIAIQMNSFAEAAALIGKGLATFPHHAAANFNHAVALTQMGRYDAALAAYDLSIQFGPPNVDAYCNRGAVLAALKRYEDALASYDQAFQLKPDFPALLGTRLYLKMLICDWRGLDRDTAALVEGIARGACVTSSLPILALTDSPSLQRDAATIWTMAKYPPNAALGPAPSHAKHRKIRVGYFSMDFRDHPVSTLLAGVFEAHDREKFEITAFSYGPDTADPMRRRLEQTFDKFLDVRLRSDQDIAALAREMEIDIAVDLAGHTDGARSGIFALRAAPIQVSYIGYPATMGAGYIDYIIADSVVIPEAARAHYTEKVVWLPNFQANDAKRIVAERIFTRQELGLPPSGVVFCCFNNTYKITPDIFGGWMRILARTPDSVLFLYADTDSAAANLKAEAVARGVGAERLIFGKRLAVPEYLARYRAADLFLDTNPFNAGATASDALWMGVPVLTRMGNSYVGRMAASLLRSLDLPELITSTGAEYEALAVALALDPARLQALKQKLARNRLASSLFDTVLFARRLERAFDRMIEEQRAGQAPTHIYIEP